MRYGWCGWPGLGIYPTLTSPINLMAFGGPLVTLWWWWGVKNKAKWPLEGCEPKVGGRHLGSSWSLLYYFIVPKSSLQGGLG